MRKWLILGAALVAVFATPAFAHGRGGHGHGGGHGNYGQGGQGVVVVITPAPQRGGFYHRDYVQPYYYGHGPQTRRGYAVPQHNCSSARHPDLICYRQDGSKTWYRANSCGVCDAG